MEKTINPFDPIYDKNSKILILGTFPSPDSRKAGFYYMNKRNRFWNVLKDLFHEDFPAMQKEEKITALLRHNVALYDVIHSCEIEKAEDNSIKNEIPTDIDAILASCPNIKCVFLNGKKAEKLFYKHFKKQGICAETAELPSTSPANAKLSLDDLVRIWGEAILPYLQ